MDLFNVLGILTVMGLMAIYEWPKMKPEQKREKIVFVLLTVSGGILAVLLLFVPELPGPADLVDTLYKPLIAMLESWIQERSG